MSEFCQTIKEELMPIILKLFPKVEENTSKLILREHIILITKPDRQYKKRKLLTNIFDKHSCKC